MRDDLLIVVDMQNDFVTHGGALYFKEVEKIKPVILDCVNSHIDEKNHIVLTQDWHEQNDVEFKLFPPHCVADSEGAQLFNELESVVWDYERAHFIRKRKFSAFYGTNLDELLDRISPKRVGVCGVATNICVMYTVEELRNREYEVVLYKDGIASYDDSLHKFALSQMKDVLGAEVERWR